MPVLDRPVYIIGCNRSGTTSLMRNLTAHPGAWGKAVENTDLFREIFPANTNRGDSVEPPVTEESRQRLTQRLYEEAHNKQALLPVPEKLVQRPLRHFLRPGSIRLVDKTPENCFRVELLDYLYPDARFLYVIRDGREVISSLMEGWKRWGLDGWHYLRPPGWLEMRDKPLVKKCLFQWEQSNRAVISDLEYLDGDRVFTVSYQQLYHEDNDIYRRIRAFCELPESRYWWTKVISKVDERIFTRGGSPPEQAKWKRLHGEAIESVADRIMPLNERLHELRE